MNYGRQIRVFLVDGSSSGIKYAELVNWTGQAFHCPKTKIKDLKTWPESERPGVYILIGIDEQSNEAAYIGESENVYRRLQQHLANPPIEFNEIIIFTSKDDNISKGHITFLEEKMLTRAQGTKRYVLKSDRDPSEKQLSKPEKDTMLEFLENIFVVTSTLGNSIFELQNTKEEKDNQKRSKTIFELELGNAGLKASGYPVDSGFLVLKDSQAKTEHTQSLQPGYQQLRTDLVKKEILIESEGHYVFKIDYSFKNSTQAACVISGNQRS